MLKKYYLRLEDELLLILELKDNNNEYKVKEVKDKGEIKGKIYYLVKWAG